MPKYTTETAAGTVYSRNPKEYRTLQAMTKLFNKQTLGTDHVYFYPYAPMLFFLLHAENPTPYDSLVYPMATLEQIENLKTILEEKKCRWVVLSTKMEGDPLLEYLESKYQVSSMSAYALVLERKRDL